MLLLQHTPYSLYLSYKDGFPLSRNFHVRTYTQTNCYARWARFYVFVYVFTRDLPYNASILYARIKRQWKSTGNTFLCIVHGFLTQG